VSACVAVLPAAAITNALLISNSALNVTQDVASPFYLCVSLCLSLFGLEYYIYKTFSAQEALKNIISEE